MASIEVDGDAGRRAPQRCECERDAALVGAPRRVAAAVRAGATGLVTRLGRESGSSMSTTGTVACAASRAASGAMKSSRYSRSPDSQLPPAAGSQLPSTARAPQQISPAEALALPVRPRVAAQARQSTGPWRGFDSLGTVAIRQVVDDCDERWGGLLLRKVRQRVA